MQSLMKWFLLCDLSNGLKHEKIFRNFIVNEPSVVTRKLLNFAYSGL